MATAAPGPPKNDVKNIDCVDGGASVASSALKLGSNNDSRSMG
jgi:hypothetical protein